ncbi:hypothetical protein K3G39_08360 [Pontibacter sp. HSC-14F20]|uniref:hypothetical protein n=1 Tax=Pontibacter sp. HSC-14F20 TaxID=2864136 RepID=UPI001C729EFD|nr:hypothetical protein [Pontibacter sp. HSC-14F20]MBX0333249.1 hypothetical protein [Pontibacter sp. HSC-14F20]
MGLYPWGYGVVLEQMVGAIVLIFLFHFINQLLLKSYRKKFSFFSVALMNKLYFYHLLFWGVYYVYTISNPSDSKSYFSRSAEFSGEWLNLFQTSTTFIIFVAHPFTGKLGFSYEMVMLLFSWFGYIGFVHFYIFFRENIRLNYKIWGFDLLIILLFLPNMHFWTASLGKGSIIFMGLGLFAYAMRFPQKRAFALLMGSVIVYMIRPHMFMFLGVGAVIGYFTGREKVPLYQKILVYVAFAGGIFVMSDQILAMANINEEDVLGSFEDFSQLQAGRLSRASSGVNITNYPLPIKLFTFWFRPLFVDAPGALGIFVSFENLLYVILAWKLVDKDFIPFLKKSTSLVKMSLVIFISSSIALSFVMSNLGIAMRQKSMVMYFLFFVIVSFLEYKKKKKIALVQLKKRMEEQEAYPLSALPYK